MTGNYSGYRLVLFDEVKQKSGDVRAAIVQWMADQNYWNSAKLDGGKITSSNLCLNEQCDGKKMTFSVDRLPENSKILGSLDNKIIIKMRE